MFSVIGAKTRNYLNPGEMVVQGIMSITLLPIFLVYFNAILFLDIMFVFQSSNL